MLDGLGRTRQKVYCIVLRKSRRKLQMILLVNGWKLIFSLAPYTRTVCFFLFHKHLYGFYFILYFFYSEIYGK